MLQVIPHYYDATVTVDSFFVGLSWVQNQPRKIIASLSSNQEQKMMELFKKDLKHHEYRVFTDGNVTVTVFLDNKLMVTCTNAVTFSAINEGVRSGYDVSNLKPTLTVKGAEILKQIDSEDLKNLAKRCGLSSSGSKEQVVYRIAGRIPPSGLSN